MMLFIPEESGETDGASLNCALVRYCREAVLDAQVMLTIAEVAVEKANSCATDLDSFNSIEFTEKLVGITPCFLTYIFNYFALQGNSAKHDNVTQ